MSKKRMAIIATLEIVVVIFASIAMKSLVDRKHAAEKLTRETYTEAGFICPKDSVWAQWENPQREAWRTSQVQQGRKSADSEGGGCYKL